MFSQTLRVIVSAATLAALSGLLVVIISGGTRFNERSLWAPRLLVEHESHESITNLHHVYRLDMVDAPASHGLRGTESGL